MFAQAVQPKGIRPPGPHYVMDMCDCDVQMCDKGTHGNRLPLPPSPRQSVPHYPPGFHTWARKAAMVQALDGNVVINGFLMARLIYSRLCCFYRN